MTSPETTEISDSDLLQALRARIKEKPELLKLAQQMFHELRIDLETDSPQKWAEIVRAHGAAMVHGKLHPAWFEDHAGTAVEPLSKEPGYKDAGHINAHPKQFIEARPPLSSVGTEIYRYGNTYMSSIKITPGTQVVLMGPTTPAEHEYNQKMLDNRFSKPWVEIWWSSYVNSDPKVPLRNDTYPFHYKLYLPEKEAHDLFAEIELVPELPIDLARKLWPNMPLPIVAQDKLFMKHLTLDDLGKKYMEPFIGGKFISYDND
jgi:hypothetical protein